jgi:hypothetical protein
MCILVALVDITTQLAVPTTAFFTDCCLKEPTNTKQLKVVSLVKKTIFNAEPQQHSFYHYKTSQLPKNPMWSPREATQLLPFPWLLSA